MWIGLTRAEDTIVLVIILIKPVVALIGMWADQTPYRYPTWYKWGGSDPNRGELCARLKPAAAWDGGWYGRPCDNLFAYICEKGK